MGTSGEKFMELYVLAQCVRRVTTRVGEDRRFLHDRLAEEPEQAGALSEGLADFASSAHLRAMTATLDDIHRDPAILDQAIALGERLKIFNDGAVAATLVPKAKPMEPDFLARAQRIWGESPPGAPLSEIVSTSRG